MRFDWRLALSFALLLALAASLIVGVPTGRVVSDPAARGPSEPYQTDAWTATRHLSSAQNADLHFRKHGREMGIKTRDEYVRRATDFLKNPPPDAIVQTQPDGDTEIYRPSTKEFAVKNKRGVPRTYFKRTRFPSNTAEKPEVSSQPRQ